MSEVAQKLRIAPGALVLLIGAGPEERAAVGELPEGAAFAGPDEGAQPDAVLLFARTSADLVHALPAAVRAASGDRLLWVAYPKKSARTGSDLSRERVRAVAQGAGVRAVAQVAVSATWSAMRLRPPEAAARP